MNRKYILTAVILSAACFFAGCESEKKTHETVIQGRSLDYTGTLTFTKPAGREVSTIQIAVADTDDARSAGLMDVRDLPRDHGMLFIFDDDRERSFWMANTPLSLDIIFADKDGKIVRVHRNTQPFSQENFVSGAPARYVVEVNAGYTVEHDITEGDKIEFELEQDE